MALSVKLRDTDLFSMQNLIIQQETIDSFEATAKAFLKQVLNLDADQVLLTDESQLSDFTFSGEFSADMNLPRRELYRAWDSWVLAKVQQQYPQLGDITVKMKLVDIFWRIENRSAQLH